MLILGIESSCDETAASVVKDGVEVLSNIVSSQIDEHRLYGGVVPEIASRMHSEAIVSVTKEALAQADVTLDEIDAVAVTYSPGLIGALLVGINFAKALALASGKPLIAVHHLRGHIASNYISNKDLKPPFLCLVVSGGHSHIINVKSYTELELIARTRDDAAGEAFDKAARAMGMDYPGGIILDKIAETGNPLAFKLPRPTVENSPLDYSFSGLKTSIINILHKAKQKGEEINIPDLCASYRKAIVDCLCENFTQAAKQENSAKLVLAGGVSANSLLRKTLAEICNKNNWELFMPEFKYCGDNAAMIASQAYFEYKAGNISDFSLNGHAQREITLG